MHLKTSMDCSASCPEHHVQWHQFSNSIRSQKLNGKLPPMRLIVIIVQSNVFPFDNNVPWSSLKCNNTTTRIMIAYNADWLRMWLSLVDNGRHNTATKRNPHIQCTFESITCCKANNVQNLFKKMVYTYTPYTYAKRIIHQPMERTSPYCIMPKNVKCSMNRMIFVVGTLSCGIIHFILIDYLLLLLITMNIINLPMLMAICYWLKNITFYI